MAPKSGRAKGNKAKAEKKKKEEKGLAPIISHMHIYYYSVYFPLSSFLVIVKFVSK